jgi:sterol desaturase/sphingolipid hydroxylase (fatty acid hydroxylase superfamily)
MLSVLYSMERAVAPVAIALVFCTVTELVSPKDRYSLRQRLPGAIYVVLLPAALVLLSVPLHYLWSFVGVQPLIHLGGFPPLVQFFLALLLLDFLRYWEHRFEHRFWWPVHSVHHSIKELNAANSYGHPLQAIPEFFIVVLPLSLVDRGDTALIYAAAFMGCQNLLIHAPLRVHAGPLRAVYVDSRFHRIHHSLQTEHIDHNFALLFPFIDRIFGTAYMPQNEEWPATGVGGVEPARKPLDYLFRPLQHLWSQDREA